ncbi:MAG: leucine-rich repeat protein [Alistipes sp.]|nr:leucine-rich repeat protein [Alistipes sp.]
MRKIFQYILMAVAVVATASCSNELDEVLQPAGNGSLQFVVSDFPAFGESPDTRVIGTQDIGKTAWDIDDQIIVTLTSKKFGAQSAALTYNGTSWSTAVSFLYLDNETPAVSAIYAPCYEVTEDGVMKLRDGMQLGMTEYIPADCSIANGAISISFADVTRKYSRLRIAADAGQKLIVTTTGFTPAGATEVATEPYTITADKKGNAYLYGVFAEKATVSVSNGNIEMESHTFTNATEERVSYALDATYPYLTFTASAAQTMTIKTYGGYVLDESVQYSVDGGEWTQLIAKTAIAFGGDKGTLRLRGKSANGTATSSSSWAQISFGDDNVQVACSGDIRTLVDYENHATVSTANARFCSLFLGCKSLTAAPELPATTLADDCYDSMFWNCTSLTVAPELPATTLADNCYYGMFWNCTSLTAAPELPATTLTEYCYYSMFYNCTSLTVAPELPATTLAESCYEYMFYGCTSLTVAPELPATALAESCYRSMFYNCTNLTTAPELPATTLAEYCYLQMFNGCTSLTAAPKLPATTLFANCYYEMFRGCTSLTVAPELPAATLVNWCYYRMFYGCTNLSSITMLATNIPANVGCLRDWVSGVASSGTFTKAASLIQGSEAGQIPTGISGIPEGWTVVNK